MIVFDPNKRYYCSPNTKCKGFSYLQFLIIFYDKIDNCLELIENDLKNNNINYINHKNKLGWTALMLASKISKENYPIKIIELLIQYGANLDLQNNMGRTSLMISCHNSNINYSIEVIKL